MVARSHSLFKRDHLIILHRACSSPHRRVPGKFESFSSSLLGQGLPDPEEGACSVSFANVVFEREKGKPKPSPKDVFRGVGDEIFIPYLRYAPLNLLMVILMRYGNNYGNIDALRLGMHYGLNKRTATGRVYAPLFNLLSVVSLRESSRAPSVELFS